LGIVRRLSESQGQYFDRAVRRSVRRGTAAEFFFKSREFAP